MTYGFYTVGFKKNLTGYVEYGRKSYDFQEGMLAFTSPNQVMSYAANISQGATGWILFFHPQLLSDSSLEKKVLQYGFFEYLSNEALHLSKNEEQLLESIFENIHTEYHRAIDEHSKQVVLANLELLLTYSERFYSRQFVTRVETDHSFLQKFDSEIRDYFGNDQLAENGIPSVGYFAEKMNVSPNYLSDLLRKLTGKSTLDHIHFHVLEKAKSQLLSTNRSIAEISFDLGFEYPAYFSRFFKQRTSHTPKEFRSLN